MDPGRRIIQDGAIHFEDGLIVDVGPSKDVKARNPTTDMRVDAHGMVLLPNLVNAHTHTFQTLRKGWGADLGLTDWLRRVIWPLSGVTTPSDMALGATVSAAEALKSGCGFLLDQTTVGTSVESARLMAEAYERIGVKAGIAIGVIERTKRAERMKIPKERFPYTVAESTKIIRDAAHSLSEKRRVGISVWAAPVTIFSAGPDLYRAAWELCEELGLRFHTHIAETQAEVESTLEDHGCREVEFLEKMGSLGPSSSLAHCVWLSEREMDTIARTKTSVVHNPICNMYLGSGIAEIPKLLAKGVTIGLGSDGGTCGASHNMFEVMKSTALIHKARALDPKAISGYQVLQMATIGGAGSVGMEASIGSIEVGKSADVFLLDLKRLYSAPVGDIFSNIVFFGGPANVDSVFVSGKLLVQNGRLLTADEEKLIQDSQRRADEIEAKVKERL